MASRRCASDDLPTPGCAADQIEDVTSHAGIVSRPNPRPGCANGHPRSRPRHPATQGCVVVDAPDTAPAADGWVLRGCSDAMDQAARMGPGGTLLPYQPGRSTRVLDWRARVGPDSTKRSGLLIRGFGVRVPGGAPVIKALTWWFSPDQSHFHVYYGWLGARGVLWSRWTKPAPGGPDGLGSTIGGTDAYTGLVGPMCVVDGDLPGRLAHLRMWKSSATTLGTWPGYRS